MAPAPMEQPSRFAQLRTRLWRSWKTRSLVVGAASTAVDLIVGLSALWILGEGENHSRYAAMAGTVVGCTFNFLANRYFAFRENNPKLASPAIRFIIVTTVQSLVHGQVVSFLRDGMGVPFVPSKMIGDVIVFTFAQLLVLRYIVFPKKKGPPEEPLPAPESDALPPTPRTGEG